MHLCRHRILCEGQIKDLGQIKATFAEEIVPRGKEEKVQLFSLEYQ
ncbi:MAG: hypothetical protein R2824_30100 [Saprospiraceae bacterium]|nr:hypothetical protein [Lewinella sp.]